MLALHHTPAPYDDGNRVADDENRRPEKRKCCEEQEHPVGGVIGRAIVSHPGHHVEDRALQIEHRERRHDERERKEQRDGRQDRWEFGRPAELGRQQTDPPRRHDAQEPRVDRASCRKREEALHRNGV